MGALEALEFPDRIMGLLGQDAQRLGEVLTSLGGFEPHNIAALENRGAPDVLRALRAVAPEVDTVISVGVAARCDERGDTPLEDLLRAEGWEFWRGKTNLGLGRPLFREVA